MKPAGKSIKKGIALLDDVNFRKGDFAYKLADEGTRRNRRMLIIAAARSASNFA